MSKICEACGNIVPEQSKVCPRCGKAVSGRNSMEDLLNELSFSIGNDAVEEAPLEENPLPEESTEEDIGIVIPDAILGGSKNENPAEEASDHSPSDAPVETAEETAGQMPENSDDPFADLRLDSAATPATVTPSYESSREPVKREAERPHHSATSHSSEHHSYHGDSSGKKKKKSGTKSLVIAVVCLIVALLLIGAGALFMLNTMGFFDKMSEDELLGVSNESADVDEDASDAGAPLQITLIGDEPFSAEEEAEVSEAPAEETASDEEETVEPMTSPEIQISCTKFALTEDQEETVSLYSRGETATIGFEIEPSMCKDYITWTSSDDSIATVSKEGVISARRGGDCTITGSCGDFTVELSVYCGFTVPSTVVDMNYEDVTMNYEGQQFELEVDADITDEMRSNLLWESTDTGVVTVDENGIITAQGDGTAVVTASLGSYTASCIVRCVGVTGNRGVNSDSSEYTINYEDVTLTRKGEYFTLELTSILGNEVPSFTWKSDDPSVATVDAAGTVTAVANGTAYITATVGGDDFECIVRVNFE